MIDLEELIRDALERHPSDIHLPLGEKNIKKKKKEKTD